MKCNGIFSHLSDEWSTPFNLFQDLNEEFHFSLDPCCTVDNHKCDIFFTIQENGLLKSWGGHRVFVNPPYSQISVWLSKAISEKCFCVFLVPARTDTAWFHDLALPYFDVRFIRGRIHFNGSKYGAPFPSILLISKFGR